MRRLTRLTSRLGIKVFVTYLIIIGIGGVVLVTAAEMLMPLAFDRHLAVMATHMGGTGILVRDLYASFQRALIESLLVAAAAATAVAIGVSYYVSRRIVRPIEQMEKATRRIADGHYGERVELVRAGAAAEGLDEIERLALSFNQMAARLAHTEQLRQELIGNVAHELRMPLTTIRGYVEGLADGVLAPDAATLETIHQEIARLQRLVADLQELSRLEEGAFGLNLRPLDLAPVARATAERLRPQFESKGVALTLTVPDALPPVIGDSDRLAQVLTNMLGNALQYTPPGAAVTLSAEAGEGALLVQVIDQGIGIAAEHLPHLFERFYRVDRARSRVGGGTGIGLTICKLLVEAHGGTIWASSQGLGQGSTFSFSIPLAGPAPAA